MDELAVKAGKDPLQFRRQHAGGSRYQELINKLEEVSGWKTRDKNSGYGVAITECFGSIVGEVVKVSKNAEGKIRVQGLLKELIVDNLLFGRILVKIPPESA